MPLVHALAFIALGGFNNPKADCIKALAAAHRVGLPRTPKDLEYLAPTRESKRIEALFAKALAASGKGRPSTSKIIDIDFENIDRKKKGLKPLPYPQPNQSELQDAKRIQLEIIHELGKTKGRRIVAFEPMADLFPRGALVKALLKLQVENIRSNAKTADPKLVCQKLNDARRLVDLSYASSQMVPRMIEVATAAIYLKCVEQAVQSNPILRKSLSKGLLAPFQTPTLDQTLKEEYLQFNRLFFKDGWKLPADEETLEIIARSAKSWRTAYLALRGAKSGAELEKRYHAIRGKLDAIKTKGEDPLVLGPDWADRASVLDKTETRRKELIKKLGLKIP